MRKWEGGVFGKNCYNWHPPIFLVFELHKHNVPQKDKFFMNNSGLGDGTYFSSKKMQKNQIFLMALFHIGVLYTKILNANSDI